MCLVLLGMGGETSSNGTLGAQEIASPNGTLVSLFFRMDAAPQCCVRQHVAVMSPVLQASWLEYEKS